MRYRVLMAYDGTAYLGFQWQPEGLTVQGEVERVLAQVTQQCVRVQAAGRTDAGVHALGQVIGFDVQWRHQTADLHRAMNALLPPDIVARKLQPAPSDFHPRYDAQSRVYRYSILNEPWQDPLLRQTTCHVPEPLDVAAMDCAAQRLVGVHDFAAFGTPFRTGGPTVRHVLAARCWQENILRWDSSRLLVHFEIEANAFLRRMVRRLMGTLVWVGRGRCSVGDLEGMVEAGAEGRAAAPSMAPQGLCLQAVVYDWQWA